MSSSQIVIKSKPEFVFRGLLVPSELSQWWGCTAVVDARHGGVWVGGWGEDAEGLGQGTILLAELAVFEKNSKVGFKIGQTVITFVMELVQQGTSLTISQEGYPSTDPAEEKAALQSWVDAATNLKAFVEKKNPYIPPQPKVTPVVTPEVKSEVTQSTRSASPTSPSRSLGERNSPAEAASSLGKSQGLNDATEAPTLRKPAPVSRGISAGEPARDGGGGAVDPYGGLEAMAQGDIRILDDAGFGVTNPHAVIKSWSKEQGFGYVTHEELGDVVFDYDGCDFEPSIGDKVILLVLGKRFDGKPKVKRIACPDKGSKLKK